MTLSERVGRTGTRHDGTVRRVWPSRGRPSRARVRVEGLEPTDIAARFTGAKAELVRRHLDILEVMGEVMQNPDGRFQGAA